MNLERRMSLGLVTTESREGTFNPVLKGYAIVFNARSLDLGGFREIIRPEAVQRTMREKVDLRALIDHNTEKIIGRLTAGTLRAAPDSHGLRVEIDLPATSYARDLQASVARGDVSGMSFAFRVMPDGDEWRREGQEIVRYVNDMLVSECSVVSMPAYPQTEAAIRSLREFEARAPRRSVETLRRELRQRMASWR